MITLALLIASLVQGPTNVTCTIANPTTTVSIDGGISVTNFPAVQQSECHYVADGGPVTIVGTVTVTGPLTDAQARASALPVEAHIGFDGGLVSILGTVPISAVSLPSHGVTGPITNAEARATPLPVGFDGGLVSILGTVPVSGTFFQGTQPVSLATLPALTGGSAVIGHVVVDTAPSTAVTGTFFQGTQPVSIASMPSTPVTGTFFQAIQPMSVGSLPTHSVTAQGPDGGTTFDVSGSSVTVAPHIVFIGSPPLNPLFPRCNPVRRTGCQP